MLPLVLDNVTFAVDGRAIIDGISAEISAGPRSVILGPNGAGKSVLMRLCHGLLRPTSGAIRWQGTNGEGRRQAMVFQRPVMLRRSALANVTYALELAGFAPTECRLRALDVLEAVGLADAARRPARVLSGGEQQRLALAIALANDPPLILADEPTGNLDSSNGRHVLDLLLQVRRSRGVTLVLVTHDPNVAAVADDRLVLRDGRPVVSEIERGEPRVTSPLERVEP